MNYYDLTNPQKSIWEVEQFYKGTNINNICGTLTIKQNVDLKILNEAVNIFVQNNKSFGINLIDKEGKTLQYFTNQQYLEYEKINLKDYKEVQAYAKKIAEETFDIYGKRLYRFILFKLENGYGGFIILAHHIISDAGTFALIGTEIAENYRKLLENEEIEKKDYSYENYINDEKEYMQSTKFKKDEEYWNNLYKTVPEIASVPSIKSRGNINLTGKAKRIEYIIDKKLLNRIAEFCKKNKISNFNFFMAVYSIYLSRVSNLKDFSIGTPILNRSNFKEKHMSGMFINTAALRINIQDNVNFVEFVKQIAKDSLSMLRYQKYPYEMLLENLRKEANGLPTLYDVMLSYQITKAHDKEASLPYEVEWFGTSTISNGIYIHLHDNNDEESLNIAYDYQVEKYDEADIENMHMRILNIVDQVLENENIEEQDIEIITEYEKNKIVYKFNDTNMDYPKDKTIIELFEKQVEKTPENIAVCYDNEKLTYEELNEKANQLAKELIDNGIHYKDVVGVLLPRSIELVISIWAILKCGGIYMPLYIEYPEDRIDYMIKNSNAKFVLTNNNLKSKITEVSSIIINNYKDINPLKYLNKYCDVKNNDIAYIIYTSGSTGKPKGVQISHKNLNNFIHSFNKYFCGVNSEDNFLSTTNISFDVSIFELFLPLIKGATLVLYHNELIKDIIDYCDYIIEHEITGLYIPPNILNEVYFILKDKKNIKIDKLLVGVEAIRKETLDKYFLLNPKMNIVNGYGPTETTICCTALPYKKDMRLDTDIVPIGRALYNNNIYILDNSKRIQPIGILGELYVTGDGVGAGYINNNAETDKNYLINTFDNSSEKMYKTGDIGKWNNDGAISLAGRKDNQVKISGYRIELDEIDTVIMSYSNIDKSITIVKDIKNKKRIISYFTALQKIRTSDIEEYLSKKLASYMIPYKLIQIDSLPLTSNGKIDKKLLPLDMFEGNKEYINPQNTTQEKLYRIWCDLFDTDKIDIYDNFFHIGGDSLLCIKLVSRIYEEFKIKVNVNKIFSKPTIKALADVIDSSLVEDIEFPIIIQPKKEFYPISSAQKRIYLASNMDKDSYLYNICGGILLNSVPNIDKLQNSLQIIVKRHDSLRTYFEVINGKIVQKIADNLKIQIEIQDVNTNNADDLFYIYSSTFELSQAPLFKVFLFKLPNGKALFMLNIHHIIFDGTSLNNFMQELSEIYNGQNIPELKISYKDFAVWEEEKLKNNGFDDSKKFWSEQFKEGIPILNLPTSHIRPAKKSFKGASKVILIQKELTEKINKYANSNNITSYMLMLACYYILLYNYTDSEDIIIGTPVSGRLYKELEPLLGMFVNSIPLKNNISKDMKFKEFLENIKKSCIKAFEHQDYPFDLLVNDLNIPRDASRNPLFDTMFVYQNNGLNENNFDGIETNYCIPTTQTSKFDISLEVLPIDGKLQLSFEYATDLFDEIFISNFSRHYKKILELVLENSNISIADISVFNNEDKSKLFYKFNKIELDKAEDNSDIKIFQKHTDNMNIPYKDKYDSYQKINDKVVQFTNNLNETNLEDTVYTEPRNNIESQIAGVFKELLPVSTISIDDNFFDLGGDSLSAINLQIELLKLNYNLTYADIFECPTIRELANKISSSENQ